MTGDHAGARNLFELHAMLHVHSPIVSTGSRREWFPLLSARRRRYVLQNFVVQVHARTTTGCA